jgi:type I restriction enzyme S subunit
MQQLLTGKKRLAGFSGEWEVKRLGDVADIIGGGTPSTFVSNYWNGNINWFTPTEIGTEKYVFDSVRKITKDGLINCSAKILPIGTILLTTRAGIGDISILKKEACTNQGFQSFVTKDSFYNEFLYYLISTLKNVLIQNASGSTFLEISPNKIKQIQISIPTIEEQTAIATILSDMDAEISQLEGRRAKMGELKQGMMQELLTGRIRLTGGRYL